MRRGSTALALLAALALVTAPARAAAQVFISSRAHPVVTVGPLTLRANVGPALGPADVALFFSVVVPPAVSGAAVEGDLYLLWPGDAQGRIVEGLPDPALRRDLEARGFEIVGEGRLQLQSRLIFAGPQRPRPEPVAGGAPYATYVRRTSVGVTAPATWIRIPWHPRLVNRVYRMELGMRVPDLIRTRRATWLENFFWGERHTLALGFHEIRTGPTFPLYLQHRTQVVRLADEPNQITVNFDDADHLKIQEVQPPSARRRPSEARPDVEAVSLYLDANEGLKPQQLVVQFTYFTGWKSWAPIVVAGLFFVLGNLAGPLLVQLVRHFGPRLQGRIHFGPQSDATVEQQVGTVVPREVLSRLQPGETTYEEVLRLCGPDPEEYEQLSTPDRRTLVYRGRRVVPHPRRRFAWLATVHRWDVEHHEVEVELQGDRVQHVQARVRRARLAEPQRSVS